MTQDLTKVIPQLLAQGLLALRENAIMPQLVNRGYEPMAGPEGSTIDVPIPSAVGVHDVTPAATSSGATNTDLSPTSVPIQLNRWKEAAFTLSDKEQMEVMNGALPMMASEAIKAIANEVDQYILSLFSKFYGFVGTPGTTPLGVDTSDVTQVRAALNKQLAPLNPRNIVMNPDMEGNALNLRAFQDASWSGSIDVIRAGRLNERLGFAFWMDQNVQNWTAGTAPSSGAFQTAGTASAGDKTINVDQGSGSGAAGTVKVGDVITFASHTQTYVVTGGTPAPVSGTITTPTVITIEPGVLIALADNEAITIKGRATTYANNAVFHRDAIAFATRPLAGSNHPASIIDTQVDEVSGLTLRLEVTREFKRDRFSFDILYGGDVVRRELGARVAG